jgi:hypothetical protein
MINHFKSYLLNKPREFTRESLFSGANAPADFVPAKPEVFTRPVWETLFGENPDASLMDYRFFQFVCLIGGCGLSPHITRFDSRETYTWEDFSYSVGTIFQSVVDPAVGLSVITVEDDVELLDQIRQQFKVTHTPVFPKPQITYADASTLALPIVWNAAAQVWQLQNSNIGFKIDAYGAWSVDYRQKPKKPIIEIVNEALNLSPTVYQQLFAFISTNTPEYADGFWHITDIVHKFCMLLFGLACANEKLTQDS